MTDSTTYYVYILCRPNGKPFYIGKGQGIRVFRHDDEARRGHKCQKCNTIRKIWRNGGQIQRYIVFTTNDEQEALTYEREMIALHGRENLTNLTDGGDGGPAYTGEMNGMARYSWEIVRSIRTRWLAGGVPQKQLAAEYGMNQTGISKIVLNKMWHDPEYTPPINRRPLRISTRGAASTRASFTWEQVHLIRTRYVNREANIIELAAEYSVGTSTIHRIIQNQAYTDPAYTPPTDRRERVDMSPLTWTDVQAIRARRAAGNVTLRVLAEEYGVGQMAISNIVNRKTWKGRG